MTIERAIEILNLEHREHYDSIETINEACRMGMEALEKQIPKKPIKDKYHRYCCPFCEYIVFINNPALIDEFVPYCENCGQALDWTGV